MNHIRLFKVDSELYINPFRYKNIKIVYAAKNDGFIHFTNDPDDYCALKINNLTESDKQNKRLEKAFFDCLGDKYLLIRRKDIYNRIQSLRILDYNKNYISTAD